MSNKILQTIFILFILLASTISVVAQSAPRSITVSIDDNILVPGQMTSAAARIYPGESNQNVVWKSSNTSVASIDQSGVITAISQGFAYITAVLTNDSEVKGTVRIVVTDAKVKEIKIQTPYTDIAIGEKVNLYATIIPDLAKNKDILWKSSNPTVFTVDQSGTITGVGVGTAMVTAVATDGSNVAKRLRINVFDMNANITLTAENLSIYVDEEIQLYPKLEITKNGKTETTVDDIVLEISNNSVAYIDNQNKLHGLREGIATVTASSLQFPDIKVSVDIEILERPTKILVSEQPVFTNCTKFTETLQMFAGQDKHLFSFVQDTSISTPSEESCEEPLPAAVNQALVWRSDNPEVAAVSPDGLIIALSAGTANIIVEQPEMKQHETICVIVEELTFQVDSITIEKDKSQNITLYLSTTNGNPIQWQAEEPEVAVVSDDGKVFGIEEGETNILAMIAGYPETAAKLDVKIVDPFAVISAEEPTETTETKVTENITLNEIFSDSTNQE